VKKHITSSISAAEQQQSCSAKLSGLAEAYSWLSPTCVFTSEHGTPALKRVCSHWLRLVVCGMACGMGRLQLVIQSQRGAWPDRAHTWTGKGQDRAVSTLLIATEQSIQHSNCTREGIIILQQADCKFISHLNDCCPELASYVLPSHAQGLQRMP